MIPTITWRKSYELGIPEIDAQHKNLMELINLTIIAKCEGKQESVLKEVFYKTIEYTKVHFASEENHMARNGYPVLQTHKLQHRELVAEIVELLEKLHKGEQAAMMNLPEILKSWFVNHILKRDKEYGNYLLHKNKLKNA